MKPLTLGDLRKLTAKLPDSTPLGVGYEGCESLRGVHINVERVLQTEHSFEFDGYEPEFGEKIRSRYVLAIYPRDSDERQDALVRYDYQTRKFKTITKL